VKKFLVLPIVLAIGFAILIIINTESTGGGNAKEGEEITTPSGLKITDLKVGSGKEAKKGDVVVVNYTGWLKDGTKFDSSLDRNEPLHFEVGESNIIKGWNEGVAGMRVGGKRKLVIPAELGYGPRGSPPKIPPNAELTFEIELLSIR
jgi:FKBP-type peptidyl-prolyl cis-trans isomerase